MMKITGASGPQVTNPIEHRGEQFAEMKMAPGVDDQCARSLPRPESLWVEGSCLGISALF